MAVAYNRQTLPNQTTQTPIRPPTGTLPNRDWTNQAAARSYAAPGMDFSQGGGGQIGNAWMDQYNPSGGSMGRQNAVETDHSQMVEQARAGTLIPNNASVQSAALAQATRPNFHSPRSGYDPEAGMSGINKRGDVGYYRDPTQGDRFKRAGVGALKGYDTGNRYGNAAVQVGTGMAGLGTANRVAGAVQGYSNNDPVFRRGSAPSATSSVPQTAAAQTPGQTRQPSQASRDALNSAMTDPSGLHRPMAGGGDYGYQDPSQGGFYGGGGGYQGGGGEASPTGRPPGGGVALRTSGDGKTLIYPDGTTRPNTPDSATMVLPNGARDPFFYSNEQAYGEDIDGDGWVGDPNQVTYPEDPNRAWQVGHPPGDNTDEAGPQVGGAEEDALKSVLQGGQQYQTDGSNGRVGTAGAGGGGYDFGGFDFAQDPANRDVGKSAKYAFSHLAGLAGGQGVPQPRTKEEAESWFVQHIQPGMEALGYKVSKVVGDKAFISTRENPGGEWIDFVGNAGGEGRIPLTWQSEGPSALEADPEAIFAVDDFGGAGGGPSGMARGVGTYTSDGTTPNMNGVLDSGNNALNQLGTTLVQRLLEGAALDDTLGRDESRRRVGITPESLKAVGF